MSDPVSDLKQELLAAAERQQGHAVPARKSRRRWLERSDVQSGRSSPACRRARRGRARRRPSNGLRDRRRAGLLPRQGLHRPAARGSDAERAGERRARRPLGGKKRDPPARTRRGHSVRAWVYADGRIIWDRGQFPGRRAIPEGANEFISGYLEQRLTPEGVELVRSEVAGLFDRSRTLLETVPADDPRPGSWQPLGSLRSRKLPSFGVSGSARRRPARPPPVASIGT